jgi:hypothetical protein
MPLLIAAARMYRGEHHPTDILSSLLFAALWLSAATILVKPNEDAFRRGARLVPGGHRREAAGRGREAEPADQPALPGDPSDQPSRHPSP